MVETPNFIDALSPFLQGLLGSAALLLILWLSRLALDTIRKFSKAFYRGYSKDILFKYWVHKNLVKSRELYLFTLGHLLIFRQAFKWILRAGLIVGFFAGVYSFLNRRWLILLCSYFVLNCLLEASSWLKDWGNEKYISSVVEETKDELLKMQDEVIGKREQQKTS